MNQQPDKLFREKLEGYQKTAPASAWDKIEAGLEKKPGSGLWLRIAAAIVVLAVAAFVLWPNAEQQGEIQPLLAETTKPETSRQDELQPSLLQEAGELATEKNTVRPIQKKRASKKESTSATAALPEEPSPDEHSTEYILADHLVAPTEPVQQPTYTTGNATLTTAASEPVDNTTVTLIYSAEEVNEKYFNQDAYAKATSDKKKTSSLKRLLNKAYDLKNNEDPFGELRQKKNEILALNSITGKQRTETK